MGFWEWFADVFKTNAPQFPTEHVEITLSELNKILRKELGHELAIYNGDRTVWLTDMETAKAFSAGCKYKQATYGSDLYDCENFSYTFMGYWANNIGKYAVGIAWSKIHAFNFMADKDKQLWIVDPQGNKWMRIEDAKKNELYYPIRVIQCFTRPSKNAAVTPI